MVTEKRRNLFIKKGIVCEEKYSYGNESFLRLQIKHEYREKLNLKVLT